MLTVLASASLDGMRTETRGCKAAAAKAKERPRRSGAARNCGIISQTVTVGPQITEGRVVHTGSAFLFFTVTAPTSVCLNWGFDTWRDYSRKSLHPRLHSSPFLCPEDRLGHRVPGDRSHRISPARAPLQLQRQPLPLM